ncbi:MAG: DUF4258 domain-containing protein [Dehalococcoidia bacterium]|nr:DUF4258 domain-containing protein [Dehalococcoidia bacterium]
MPKTLSAVIDLVARRDVRISGHGYDGLAADNILVRDVMSSVAEAQVVKDYPDYPKGPCVLVLQRDRTGMPIHVIWGIPKGASAPAVLVTAYRPDGKLWTSDFLRRKP